MITLIIHIFACIFSIFASRQILINTSKLQVTYNVGKIPQLYVITLIPIINVFIASFFYIKEYLSSDNFKTSRAFKVVKWYSNQK